MFWRHCACYYDNICVLTLVHYCCLMRLTLIWDNCNMVSILGHCWVATVRERETKVAVWWPREGPRRDGPRLLAWLAKGASHSTRRTFTDQRGRGHPTQPPKTPPFNTVNRFQTRLLPRTQLRNDLSSQSAVFIAAFIGRHWLLLLTPTLDTLKKHEINYGEIHIILDTNILACLYCHLSTILPELLGKKRK